MGRTGALSEGRVRRAGKVHDTRCVHKPSRQAGEGEDGQRRACAAAAHTHADKRSRWADRQVGRVTGAPGVHST